MSETKKIHTVKIASIALVAAFLLSGCASQYIKDGKSAYNEMRYQDAIWYLEKGLSKKQDDEGKRMLASSYFLSDNYKEAVAAYGESMNGLGVTDEDRINYGKALMSVGRYDEAKTIFEGILSRNPSNEIAQGLLSSCKKVNEFKADSLMYSVSPVNIPTVATAFSAVPYNGGLLFSSSGTEKSAKDPYTNDAFTDLYYTKNSGGTWTNPEPMTQINGKFHDAAAVISPNGQLLVFTKSFQLTSQQLGGNKKNVSMTQLYQSRKTPEGWSKPELVSFSTSEYMFAHPSFSKDGTTLYFSSDMPGGTGEMDLYSSKLENGNWGTPKNLGSAINSRGNELFPTTSGNDTLYFSSDSRKSLGGMDILFSVKDKEGNFGAPVHLSYPINSSADDFGLVWTDKSTGILTSNRSGSDRIYSVTAESPEISFSGMVTGKSSMLPLGGSKITVINVSDGTEKVIFTDGNGQFETNLEPGKDYKIKTDLDGYFSTTEEISTKGVTANKKIEKVYELTEVFVKGDTTDTSKNDNASTGVPGKDNPGTGNVKTNVGSDKSIYPVPNIYWDYNKWDIRPDAEPYLDEVAKLFKDNQNLQFQIRSHCDCRGSFEYNDDLSAKRAKAAADYLVNKGVPRYIITSKGFGERELVNECADGVYCDEAKHQENRRTEFIVTEKK